MDDDALAIEYDVTPRSGGDRKSAPARNSTNLKTRKRGLKRGVDGELSLNEHVYVEFTPEGKLKMRDGEKLKGQWSAEEDGRLADLVAKYGGSRCAGPKAPQGWISTESYREHELCRARRAGGKSHGEARGED